MHHRDPGTSSSSPDSAPRGRGRRWIAGAALTVVTMVAGVVPAGALGTDPANGTGAVPPATTATTAPATDDTAPTAAAPSTTSTAPTASTTELEPAPLTTAGPADPALDESFITGPAPGEGTPRAGRGPDGTVTEPDGPVTYATSAVTSYVTGPDVSSWQHVGGQPIAWSSVAGGGHGLAFVKATEGPSSPGGKMYTNPWFAADWAGAGNAGLYRGAYHFARPMLPISTALDQARAFVAVIGTTAGGNDMAPVLDIEVTGGLGAGDLTNWSLTFVQEVQRLTGRKPIVYTGRYFWQTYLGNTTALSSYPLWYASWTSADSPGAMFGGWSSWSLWQFTDSASVPGISGGVDLNRACCGTAGLALLTGGGLRSYLRSSNTTGIADITVNLSSQREGTPVACDFNGDGTETTGAFDRGIWTITGSNSAQPATSTFGFGQGGDIPVCGDWDGNGTDTPGVVRNGVWYLTNHLGSPTAEIVFGYGDATDTPIVGDWDGRGKDRPGVHRADRWYLSLTTGRPLADIVSHFGNPSGDMPLVGDWDGNGTDTIGVFRRGTWYLSNAFTKGIADVAFLYGNPTDTPITGRWGPGRPTTIGIVRPF